MNTWLNVATALGTIGAVIVSLFLSGKETRNRKKQEEENILKIKSIIILSLTNAMDKTDYYAANIKNAQETHPFIDTNTGKEIKRNNGEITQISYDAYRLVHWDVNSYKTRDHEYIFGQLDVLRKIDLNVLPTELIEMYHEAYTATVSLEQWFLRLKGLSAEQSTDAVISNLNSYAHPLKAVLNAL